MPADQCLPQQLALSMTLPRPPSETTRVSCSAIVQMSSASRDVPSQRARSLSRAEWTPSRRTRSAGIRAPRCCPKVRRRRRRSQASSNDTRCTSSRSSRPSLLSVRTKLLRGNLRKRASINSRIRLSASARKFSSLRLTRSRRRSMRRLSPSSLIRTRWSLAPQRRLRRRMRSPIS